MSTEGGSRGGTSSTGKGLPKLSEAEIVELSKPIIFGNHQKLFKLFSWLAGAGILYYMVFRHNFGDKEHCFSWIRRWRNQKMKQFFHIDPDDVEVQKIKQERTEQELHDDQSR